VSDLLGGFRKSHSNESWRQTFGVHLHACSTHVIVLPLGHVRRLYTHITQRDTSANIFSQHSSGAGTIFWFWKQTLVKNNKDNQIQSLTLCNM